MRKTDQNICRLAATDPERKSKRPDRVIGPFLVEMIGFEPTTSALQGRRSPS